jgi:acetyl esterase
MNTFRVTSCKALGGRALALAPLALVALLGGSMSRAQEPAREQGPPPDVADAHYGPAARNVLDLWQARSSRPTPLIIFFHGGSFLTGGKELARGSDLLKWALEAGVSYASVNYRYAKDGVFLPAPMQDGARAVQVLRSRAREWNLDPGRFAAYGVSAGAGIALWIAFHDDLADRRSADPVARESSRLTAAGSINGQISYDPRLFREVLGHPADELAILAALHGVSDERAPDAGRRFDSASPMVLLTRDDPPVFTYYRYPLGPVPAGGAGYTHNPRFGVLLKERMDALGIECVFRHLGDYAAAGSADAKKQAQQGGDRDLLAFFLRHLDRSR